MTVDDLSASQLAERLVPALLSIRSITDRFKIDADDAVVFMLLGSMNFQKTGHLSLWAPVSSDDMLSHFENCPRDRLLRQLRRLKNRGLVQATATGYVISDVSTWRDMSLTLVSIQSHTAQKTSPEIESAIGAAVVVGVDHGATQNLLERMAEAIERIDKSIAKIACK